MDITRGKKTVSAQIKFVDGENFTGRSSYLRSLLKFEKINGAKLPYGVMVGEIPSNYISGLAPTVAEEISLHINKISSDRERRLKHLLSSFAFDRYLDKNPFELSGGEQAILAVVCSLLLAPNQLAIDTILEQLNKAWRSPLLAEFLNSAFDHINISIADNRFEEYFFPTEKIKPPIENSKNNSEQYFGRIVCPSTIKLNSFAKNLSLNELSFSYSKKQILLEKLNYEFMGGNVYHLNGINGAGKSTLAKILTGVLKPSSGKIYLDRSPYNSYLFPGRVVGYSFQNPDEQIFSNSIGEEILPQRILKENKNVEMAKVILASFALNNLAEKHPAEMPFVIRKRIALAATLAKGRDWYILDEPTLGQDQKNVDELSKLIKLLATNGKGIILISHSERFISSFDNVKIVNLDNGKLIS